MVAESNSHKAEANTLFTSGKYEIAINKYDEAVAVCPNHLDYELAVLRSNSIVSGRKEGVSVRYAVRDPLIGTLLETARQIFNNQLAGSRDLLRQLKREGRNR